MRGPEEEEGPPAGPAGLRDLARPHLHTREVKEVV